MSQQSPFDTSIPVLTEVVSEPVLTDVIAEPVLTDVIAAPSQAPDAPEQIERRAVERWSGEEWGVLERRVTERVLQQLQGRVDFVLEQRLRDGIADAVRTAMDGFTADIRCQLQRTIEQVVTQAVSQEINHLRTLGK